MRPIVDRVDPGRDLDAIVEIAHASFSNPWTREMFNHEVSSQPLSRSYVLRVDGDAVAAFCTCWLVVDELHINTLAVRPALRERGLATFLLEEVLRDAVEQGAKRALLEVRASNVAAVRLYERLGFSTESVRTHYYSNPVEDALLLVRQL